jgi:hypothetical protein
MLINEEELIEFDSYEQLSFENKDELIELFIDDFYIGDLKVWKDSEMEGREYVCINYEIIYLDTLTERK